MLVCGFLFGVLVGASNNSCCSLFLAFSPFWVLFALVAVSGWLLWSSATLLDL